MLTDKKTIGNFGEQMAADFLIRRHYQIIAHNYRINRREFDLIARQDDRTIFVEVKTLGSPLMPAEQALTRRQIDLLQHAILDYCWRNKINPASTRLDFISINLNRLAQTAKLRHYQSII